MKKAGLVHQAGVDPRERARIHADRGSPCQIANKTFTTSKNPSYHFEHNWGRGKQHLSSVLGDFILLVLLIEQANELACRVLQQALANWRSRRLLRETCRGKFTSWRYPDWEILMSIMVDINWKPEESRSSTKLT